MMVKKKRNDTIVNMQTPRIMLPRLLPFIRENNKPANAETKTRDESIRGGANITISSIPPASKQADTNRGNQLFFINTVTSF